MMITAGHHAGAAPDAEPTPDGSAGRADVTDWDEHFRFTSRYRFIALMWAAPSLVFSAFSVVTFLNSNAPDMTRYGGWVSLAIFVTLYIASWLVFDTDPDEGSVPASFYAFQSIFLLSQISLAIFTTANGGAYGMHMAAFNCAVWMLQAPLKTLPIGFGIIVTVSTAEQLFLDPNWIFPFGLFAATLSTFFARRSMQEIRRREARQRQLLAVARQSERTRMSADLHDILGHSLTGVTLKAELAKGLLDRGRSHEASEHLTDLLELSREALAQIRTIVNANRHMIVEEELNNARDMAETAGVRFDVTGHERPPAGALSSLIARIIREGTTNVVTHSRANRITITFSPDGIEIRNNGYNTRYSERSRGAGTGLESLAERCHEYGTLTWGAEGDWWTLKLTLKEAM